MPWCPKCKIEYQEGFTVCSDCDVELVDELPKEEEYIPFFQSEQKSIAEKLAKYFSYSGLKSVIRFQEELLVFIVYVPSEQRKQAQKLYQAFYFVERERHEKDFSETEEDMDADTELTEDTDVDTELTKDMEVTDELVDEAYETSESEDEPMSEEPVEFLAEDTVRFEQGGALYSDTWNEVIPEEEETEEAPEENTTAYVMKAEKYRDYNSTVSVFLGMGFLGIVFVILNIIGVLNILSGTIPNVVMGGLFIFFIYIGISTHKKAKEIRLEIDDEQKMTEEITQWLKDNITPDYLASIHDESVSDEVNFFRKTEAVKEKLQEQYPDQQEAYLDRLIDEFFNTDIDLDTDIDTDEP